MSFAKSCAGAHERGPLVSKLLMHLRIVHLRCLERAPCQASCTGVTYVLL